MIQRQNRAAEEQRQEFEQKHDEMFTSVSALNQRIEELESHKLLLISKLKSYGDRGGLEYIIKTQGLEKIDGKKMESRVNVENYDP